MGASSQRGEHFNSIARAIISDVAPVNWRTPPTRRSMFVVPCGAIWRDTPAAVDGTPFRSDPPQRVRSPGLAARRVSAREDITRHDVQAAAESEA
jgi:hypothetical protein